MYLYSALMFYKPKQHTKDVVFILYGTCCKQNIIQDNGYTVIASISLKHFFIMSSKMTILAPVVTRGIRRK